MLKTYYLNTPTPSHFYIIKEDHYNILLDFFNREGLRSYNEVSRYLKTYELIRMSSDHSIKTLKERTGYNNPSKLLNTLVELNLIYLVETMKVYYKNSKIITATPRKYELVDNNSQELIISDTNIKYNRVVVNEVDGLPPNYLKTLEEVQISDKVFQSEYEYCVKNDIPLKNIIARFKKIRKLQYYISIKQGGNVNRIYSSLSSLSENARRFLNINGQYFSSIDIKNSQAAVLIKLFMDKGIKVEKKYYNDVLNGVVYEKLYKIIGKGKSDTFTDKKTEEEETLYYDNRGDLKSAFYRSIFFVQNKNKLIFKAFEKLYPKTLKVICNTGSGYMSLAKELQDLEANIILSIIPKSEYFTVHDSIYFIDIKEKDSIIDEIREEFGFNISLHFNKAFTQEEVDKMPSFKGDNRLYDRQIDIDTKQKKRKVNKDTQKKYDEVSKLCDEGVSVKDICSKVGLSKSRISKIIKGLNNGSIKTTKQLNNDYIDNSMI